MDSFAFDVVSDGVTKSIEPGPAGHLEGLKLHGAMTIEIRRANGDLEVVQKDNLVVNAGFDFIADAIGKAASRPGVMGWIAVGTGVTAAAAGDTALGTEIARKAATYAHTAGTKSFSFAATFNPGEATGALTEAGVCNAAAAGTFLDRLTYAVVNKAAGDTLTVTFTFTMS